MVWRWQSQTPESVLFYITQLRLRQGICQGGSHLPKEGTWILGTLIHLFLPYSFPPSCLHMPRYLLLCRLYPPRKILSTVLLTRESKLASYLCCWLEFTVAKSTYLSWKQSTKFQIYKFTNSLQNQLFYKTVIQYVLFLLKLVL